MSQPRIMVVSDAEDARLFVDGLAKTFDVIFCESAGEALEVMQGLHSLDYVIFGIRAIEHGDIGAVERILGRLHQRQLIYADLREETFEDAANELDRRVGYKNAADLTSTNRGLLATIRSELNEHLFKRAQVAKV